MTKKSLLAIFFAAVLIFSLFSCGESADDGDEEYSGEVVTLNVYNWGEYISDGFEGCADTNAMFEEYFNEHLSEKYGFRVKVNYTTYANNEEMHSKILLGGGKYDVVVPSDYMIQQMISENLLQPLNKEILTNMNNIDDSFRGENATYDPNNTYSVPYTYGMVGVIYNTALVDEEDYREKSWELLWNEKYRGKLLQFNNPRDAFGSAMYYLNLNINSKERADWESALAKLAEQKPLVQGYVNDEIFNKMTTASAVAAPYYAGDFLTMAGLNEDLSFYYPNEGTNYFVDAMCVPANANYPDVACEYINFMMSEAAAVANALYIGYASPNKLVVKNEEYAEGMAELHEDWYEILYSVSPIEANKNYSYSPIYQSFSQDMMDYTNSLWESLKTENSTELWVHIASIAIVASVLTLAIYSVYIKKKRSRHYRMRDREAARAKAEKKRLG